MRLIFLMHSISLDMREGGVRQRERERERERERYAHIQTYIYHTYIHTYIHNLHTGRQTEEKKTSE